MAEDDLTLDRLTEADLLRGLEGLSHPPYPSLDEPYNQETIYLISSLKSDVTRKFAGELRQHGFDVFDDWHAAGPEADDIWRDYEHERGRTYLEALNGHHANHTFALDYHHLNRAQIGILLLPAGKSAHLELGYLIGQRKRGYILFSDGEPELTRWDLMYKFATGVFTEKGKLLAELKRPGSRHAR
jgi:hypothetical protein